MQREHLFEKTVTPSDVGKLNRLVVPKQHAERYFPLVGDLREKGLLLSFEDEAGKQWRFRYSYWRSTGSYVLTKGWSRYIKEKRLDAGDVVRFQRMRGFGMGDRLFISYRRRVEGARAAPYSRPVFSSPYEPVLAPARSAGGQQQQQPPWSDMFYSSTSGYPANPANFHAYHHSVDRDHSNMKRAGKTDYKKKRKKRSVT